MCCAGVARPRPSWHFTLKRKAGASRPHWHSPASAVVPVRPEYTPMLVFLLAVLVEQATREESDAWLARALDKLRRDKPSETTQPWHKWRVTLTMTTLGLLTMRVR